MKREVKEEASKDVQKKVKTEITQGSSKDIKVETTRKADGTLSVCSFSSLRLHVPI